MKYRLFAVLLALTVIISLGACKSRKGPIGSEQNPVQLWFMPLKEVAVYQKHAPAIEQFLEEKTGLKVETKLADSFIDIVKAFGKKKADVAFMNTLGYLLAHDWAGANAQLQYLYGDVYTTYRGEIITKVGSGIDKPADLNGKSFAFTDQYSAAGYLYALKYLKDNKIKPSRILYSGGHLNAVEMVYSGAVDAAATYHEHPGSGGEAKDARVELAKKYPDVLGVVKILALTGEIPDGPIATRKGLKAEVSDKITEALKEYAETPEGRTTLMALYNVTGLTAIDNNAYNGVRKVIKEMGKDIQGMVRGGEPYYKTSIEIGLD